MMLIMVMESSLLNYDNLSNSRDIDWRAYGKFTQRFQNVAEDENSKGGVKNAYYTIMVDYSKELWLGARC